MYYYGGYSGGTNTGCGCSSSYQGGYNYPNYGGYGYGGYGYGGYNGFGSGAAIILVLFILLVIIIGTRTFVTA